MAGPEGGSAALATTGAAASKAAAAVTPMIRWARRLHPPEDVVGFICAAHRLYAACRPAAASADRISDEAPGRAQGVVVGSSALMRRRTVAEVWDVKTRAVVMLAVALGLFSPSTVQAQLTAG